MPNLKYSKIMFECQCEMEDMAKDLLYEAKDKTENIQKYRKVFLNKILENRKNLYIYPKQANA